MSLAEEWEIFKDVIIPPNAPQVQIDEMEKAFYGGAATMFVQMTEVIKGDISEEEGADKLQGLFLEGFEFNERMNNDAK